MSVNTTVTSKITIRESLLAQALADPANNDINFNGLDETATYNATSTPPGTVEAVFEKALVAGATTLDLTALLSIAASVVSGNGLKPRCIKFRNKSGNTHVMQIATGASNGYVGAGTGFSIPLMPTQSVLLNLVDGWSAVDATHKTIDIAGTGTEIVQVAITFG